MSGNNDQMTARDFAGASEIMVPRHIMLVLRLEGVAVLLVATATYIWIDGSWLWFAILFFTPDLSMVGYLKNERIGAFVYNMAHTYVVPLILVVIGFSAGMTELTSVCVIWIAHIGFDHMFGYGLKHTSGFKHTHLSGS